MINTTNARAMPVSRHLAVALFKQQLGIWLVRGLVLLLVCLGGCAGNSTSSNAPEQVTMCLAGDTPIASEAGCLQDDAACYQLNDNSWCTGPRIPVCPAGSTALADGATCPANTRCFDVSESLTCSVAY